MKFCTYLYISISLVLEYSNAIFELLPNGEVFMCPGLNHLEVVCRSDESSFLQWNLTFPALNYTSSTRIISSSNMVGTVTPLTVENDIMFKFIIISQPPGDLLASRLSVNLISPILNGSIIMCAERGTGMDRSSEVVLHVVNANAASPATPVVLAISEQFGMDNVTVILEWINEGGGVSYNASVTPESPSAEMFTGNVSGIKLVLLYNIQYNLSTVATLCEENSAATITELNYVNCGDPITNLNVNLEYSSTLFGSQLLFWCENAKNVTTAQCSENAIWMPDPTELVCSPSSTSTAIPTLTKSGPNINVETNWTLIGICVSVGILIILCVVITTLTIVTVVIRKGFGHRRDEESVTEVEYQEKDITMSKNIVYEQVKCHKQKIALKENVAYCSTSECVSRYAYIQ